MSLGAIKVLEYSLEMSGAILNTKSQEKKSEKECSYWQQPRVLNWTASQVQAIIEIISNTVN